ncbi:hypothetical protein SAMN04488567_0986 [Limimaricola pyoseonensis]|uniref:Uncharacterized protein n=1 Tax=Limimaricola pyoseonensis TaxID=521013 RepID=A0A1G7AIX7_9RHOB|nr:hypothetical protein SAMN04488567_0986 [Limimaricola pyoseonensis]
MLPWKQVFRLRSKIRPSACGGHEAALHDVKDLGRQMPILAQQRSVTAEGTLRLQRGVAQAHSSFLSSTWNPSRCTAVCTIWRHAAPRLTIGVAKQRCAFWLRALPPEPNFQQAAEVQAENPRVSAETRGFCVWPCIKLCTAPRIAPRHLQPLAAPRRWRSRPLTSNSEQPVTTGAAASRPDTVKLAAHTASCDIAQDKAEPRNEIPRPTPAVAEEQRPAHESPDCCEDRLAPWTARPTAAFHDLPGL